MYILIAILAFGILIAVHELGHFLAAKACGVKVNEFAIGMGPAILKKQGKETLYALRVLPIGGFCAMEGEDEDTGDERAFTRQPAWKKAIILAAGATMNFVLGFLIVMILFAGAEGFYTREVTYVDRASNAASQGLMAGDEIVKLDGHRIWLRSDVSLFLERLKSPNVDVTVKRNGEKVDLHLTMTPVADPETGEERLMLGIQLGGVEKATLGAKLRYGWYQTMFYARAVWLGLSDLVTGAVGLDQMSGVVGIVDLMNEQGKEAAEAAEAAGESGFLGALETIASLTAFIAVNLAVMNLLPIPALDGGRLLFLLIDVIALKVFRKKLNPKVEGYVHAAGMVLLLGLMAVLVVKDIWTIVK